MKGLLKSLLLAFSISNVVQSENKSLAAIVLTILAISKTN